MVFDAQMHISMYQWSIFTSTRYVPTFLYQRFNTIFLNALMAGMHYAAPACFEFVLLLPTPTCPKHLSNIYKVEL